MPRSTCLRDEKKGGAVNIVQDFGLREFDVKDERARLKHYKSDPAAISRGIKKAEIKAREENALSSLKTGYHHQMDHFSPNHRQEYH